jgi:hypothetical protein
MNWLKQLLLLLMPDKAKEIEAAEFPKEFTPAQEPKKTDPPVTSAPEMQKILDQMTALIAKNEEQAKLIGELKNRSDGTMKAMEEQAATDAKTKREALIAEAIKSQKIPAKSEDLQKQYTRLLELDFNAGKAVIDALPVIGAPQGGQQKQTETPGTPIKTVSPVLKTILEQGTITN